MSNPSDYPNWLATSPQKAQRKISSKINVFQSCNYRAIFAALFFILLPIFASAGEVTLHWDPNEPTPDGYRVYQRMEGAAYDYDSPVWPTDGNDHTEATCTIAGLTDGATYLFVVRAYVGNEESGDSNEATFAVPDSQAVPHSISASSGANGSISPSGTVNVDNGGSQTFNFSPNTGHQLSDVRVDGQSVGAVANYTFSNVTQDHTIAVSFAPLSFNISASAGSNGSISPTGNVGVTFAGNRTFDFTPNTGYQISDVRVDGQSVGAVANYTFSNVTQNHSISVTFAQLPADNQPPVAEAGNNQILTAGNPATLNGSGSLDPEGGTLAYRWRQSSGPSVTLNSATMPQCSFTAPDVSQTETLSFELTVTDADGLNDTDTCVVMVNPEQQDPQPDNDGDGTPDDQDSDDDNDGMPDSWELQYKLNPLVNDANNDPDNDGATNLQEYRAGTNPKAAEGNQAPLQPTLTSPVDGATDESPTLRLKTSAFNDPDGDDHHLKTQWKIESAGQVVLEQVTTYNHLTALKVPRLVLNPSTHYSARVRFFDNNNTPSEWSAAVSFSTAADKKDNNKNRIPDSQEVSEHTDMNSDEVADIHQADSIKSLSTYDDMYLIGVSIEDSENATLIESATSIDPLTMETAPDTNKERTYGLLGCKIRVSNPGDSARALIFLSDPVDPDSVRWVRYDNIEGWKDCTGSTIIDVDGMLVERELQDGGAEDADGVANGVIVDLSGPEAASSASDEGSTLSVSDDSGSVSGGSGGSGCFIGSIMGSR